MEPGKQPFDFPAPTVAPQFAPVLGFGPAAVRLVRRDQRDAVLLSQALIQRIAIVSSVADHASRSRRREALFEGRFDRRANRGVS